MTTQVRNVNTTFVNINTELSLTNGTNYILQNVGASDIVLTEAASAPAAASRGHVVGSKRSWAFQPESGMGIYVRASSGRSSIAVTEAQ